MKRILVIGEKSYIAKSFYGFANKRYKIEIITSRNGTWQSVDFSKYDSVLHCAGIAHVSNNPRIEKLYYDINCDLAVAVAKKAKNESVKQFVFLSSILVYGSNKNVINNETIPNPDNFYGASKLKAEQELQELADNNFRLCIVRPPMVYGKGCKGNFFKLVDLAKKTPIFPDYPNKRSMIHVDNLCDFLCSLIDSNKYGFFLPQNQEYINTTELVCYIAECYNRRIYTTKRFNSLIRFLTKHVVVFNKIFGNLYYVKEDNNSDVVDFKISIQKSLSIT